MSESTLTYDEARFGRRARNGVFMGLGWTQVILFFIVLLVAVGAVVSYGFPGGILFGLVVLILGAIFVLPQYGGRPLPVWIGVLLQYLFRSATGQTEYRRKIDTQINALTGSDLPRDHSVEDGMERDKKGRLVLGKPTKLHLPGRDNQIELYDSPHGFAFAYDKDRQLGIIVAKLSTARAFALESKDRQESRTSAYDEALSSFGMIEGLALLEFSDQTRMLSSRNIREYYEKRIERAPRRTVDGESVPTAGADIEPFLDASYRALTETAKMQSVHEQWMSLAFSAKQLHAEIDENGKGIPGFIEAIMQRLGSVNNMLQEAGVLVEYWHDQRSFSSLIRSAYDPASTIEVSERIGDFQGVDPEVSGPMAVDVSWDHLHTDSGFHRVFWVSEWPRKKARMGFLESLVFAGDFPHTVTQVLRPVKISKAMKKIEARKTDWGTTAKFRDKSGRVASSMHKAEYEDIEREEDQLVDGHGSYYLTGLVTVSGTTKAELERNCGKMRDAASRSRIELLVAYGQQDAAFSAGALPLAKGMSLGVEMPW